MRVTIYAVGKLKAGPERELSARYIDRFKKAGAARGLNFNRIVEITESRATDAATRKREEYEALEKQLPDDCVLLVLDEHGSTMSSRRFADTLAGWADIGRRDLAVAIGGADGHDDSLLDKADKVLSFGKLTWPHQIVRILLAEQLYRAATILTGHPYHRD
ncbi:23S rRNA (pseudouridine(1915)-N(3))-methyltransferase RlmH [Hoeflea prorocentri]|uniref:Ribosomal RNA large subunit methyltransferase H n=1 Tax=Hoeflea prorocentri TaxID=1922333 RepID=A0A9X3UM98_9HYPH|nr:23S rRNA (pseudouridine(1915)-N(3))-methyltransferase RlmH [Hoeflea prorocentri]MCY6383455.1 23S rRNA (pseudouridine(1915)-N(3))-methyltransferase RlmH [Hoeflea prorocentri]MDA5401255.1 23S rRNA (pseudouridine(1915)-N(3))-methyltransferase RlmH [Hoeflea prorocentri]